MERDETENKLLKLVTEEVYGPKPLPTPGRIVWYQTDGRNDLHYYLPAMVTVTWGSHPGDYPDGTPNSLPRPSSELHAHLTVFTPGGFGSTYAIDGKLAEFQQSTMPNLGKPESFTPGSGTYTEWDVPYDPEGSPRSWRWPERS